MELKHAVSMLSWKITQDIFVALDGFNADYLSHRIAKFMIESHKPMLSEYGDEMYRDQLLIDHGGKRLFVVNGDAADVFDASNPDHLDTILRQYGLTLRQIKPYHKFEIYSLFSDRRMVEFNPDDTLRAVLASISAIQTSWITLQ